MLIHFDFQIYLRAADLSYGFIFNIHIFNKIFNVELVLCHVQSLFFLFNFFGLKEFKDQRIALHGFSLFGDVLYPFNPEYLMIHRKYIHSIPRPPICLFPIKLCFFQTCLSHLFWSEYNLYIFLIIVQ